MLNPRDPRALAAETHDLVVIGGGIYGIMVALEATRRGLRPLLLERDDFGGATSHNSLRVVHGGLRYLQTLDLFRFYESVAERRWFLRHFPDLVRPLPCLMPLYGEGARRPSVLRLALACNDALFPAVNAGVPRGHELPRGQVLSAVQVVARCPALARENLRGGALWYDALIQNAPRLLIEALRWACAQGARALNYVEAQGIVAEETRVTGVRARDTLSGADLRFRTPVVVNAAGPWAAEFAAAAGAHAEGIFVPALAWNVAFDRPPPADCALAVQPRQAGAQTYFLLPWKGVLLAGTGHAPWPDGMERPEVSRDQLRAFIDELNLAMPGLKLDRSQIARVFSGALPTDRPGSSVLTTRAVIADHGSSGGPRGIYSLSGIKLTTARRVADTALTRAFPNLQPKPYTNGPRPGAGTQAPNYAYAWMPHAGDRAWLKPLRQAVQQEAPQCLSDLVLRRSPLGDNPARAAALAMDAAGLFEWDRTRREREAAALGQDLAQEQRP